MIQSRDEAWVGLQYQHESVVFRPGLLSALKLFMGMPAQGRGGFSIEATLAPAATAAGAGPVGDSAAKAWLHFDVDYHLSEAGAFRLLRVLLEMGELLHVPVRLAEYSDC
jgi:hypothetical protein